MKELQFIGAESAGRRDAEVFGIATPACGFGQRGLTPCVRRSNDIVTLVTL